ncbi:DUF2304 domain-containing protein [Raineyella sp.]|uniref:DUF2304 domain-containing protein n=1 Tax=bioreactor metagenome TaxID=1076179 RepID=A0A645CEX2_9ZZZZ|nr:DUF2304 domain-containing protein [Raineyella sp.]MEA5153960.1 DUF2304 domain-containing protein [Raineyella sp.]
MLVQIAIIALGILLGYLILASRGSHGAKASVKVGLVLLVVVMIVTVLNPNLMTRIANLAGIGRGADLLLYAVTGAFLFYVLTQYLKSQSQRDVIVRLARRVALLEAEGRYAAVLAPAGSPQSDAERAGLPRPDSDPAGLPRPGSAPAGLPRPDSDSEGNGPQQVPPTS